MDPSEFAGRLSAAGIRTVAKPWESGFLGYPVVSLAFDPQPAAPVRPDDLSNRLAALVAAAEPLGRSLIATRIPAADLEAVWALEAAGFRLMESYVELDHDLKAIPEDGRAAARKAVPEDGDALRAIASGAFEHSRFHMDARIPREKADESRALWLANALEDNPAGVIAGELSGRIAGFSVCRLPSGNRPGTGKLDLIAVAGDARGRGVGRTLTLASLRLFRDSGCARGLVGTQAHNVPSMRMYEAVGFRTCAAYFSFHRHQG